MIGLLILAGQIVTSPIRVDGSIPLWGVLCTAAVLAYSTISLVRDYRAHVKMDDTRFRSLETLMEANHKELLLWVQRIH